MTTHILRGVLLAGLVALASAAYAQNPNGEPWQKFSIAIGGFTSASDSEIQVNSSATGVGVVVDLENTLNVNSRFNTVRIDTLYRYGETERHQIEFHYFESNRSGDRFLTEDLQIGDTLFPAGTQLHTEFNLNFANIDYAYAFIQDDRVRFAASGGLHVTGVGLKVESAGLAVAEDDSFTAPLPVVGLRLDVALAENWILKTAFDIFYLEYDNFKGRLSDIFLGVEWNPFKHFGFGLGFNNIGYLVEGDGSDPNGMDFDGTVKFGLTGFMIYGKYFF